MKRFVLAISGGFLCSIICLIGRKTLIPTITLSALITSALVNRIMIGFVIGISRIRVNYLIHGAIIGLLVSLTYSTGMIPENLSGFFTYNTAGIIFGIAIEFLIKKFEKRNI